MSADGESWGADGAMIGLVQGNIRLSKDDISHEYPSGQTGLLYNSQLLRFFPDHTIHSYPRDPLPLYVCTYI